MAASRPSIQVLAVYRVPIDEGARRESLRSLYFFGNAIGDRGASVYAFIDACVPLVLVDVQLTGLDDRFDIADFTQPLPEMPTGKGWQVPYDEALLSKDGNAVLMRRVNCTRGLREGRIAFYFHFFDPRQPLLWSYGQAACPAVQTVPRNLWDLMPYAPP